MSDVLETCDYYVDTQVWSIDVSIDARRWLSNFTADELPYAEDLLTAFTFINAKMSKAILRSCIERLSKVYIPTSGRQRALDWKAFLSEAIFTTIDIDDPNLTASGPQICRWARYHLGIPENQFLTKTAVLGRIASGKASCVILLDDIVGSGDQVIESWNSEVMVSGSLMSFRSISNDKKIPITYVPLIATDYGLTQIEAQCAGLAVYPGNVIDSSYSALSEDSAVWSPQNKAGALNFLEVTSKRAGIDNWKGYNNLGLTLAFSHSAPDSTLPIFSWKKNGWKPLIRWE